MDNKNLLKGTMVYSLMNLVTKMGSFIFLPIITRLLTQEEFGIVGTLGPITSLFTVILGLGLYNAQMKKYVDLKDSEDEFGSYMFSSTMIIVVFNVLTYMFLFTPFAQKMFSYIVDLSKVSYYPLIIVSILIATTNAFNNLSTTLFRMKRMYVYESGNWKRSQPFYNLHSGNLLYKIFEMGSFWKPVCKSDCTADSISILF